MNESLNEQEVLRFQKGLRSSMDGLFKVLLWRIDDKICDLEFRQIYQEWLKKRDIVKSPINTRSYHSSTNEVNFLIDLIQSQFKELIAIEVSIPRLIDLLRIEFNVSLISLQQIGYDSYGKDIPTITEPWVREAENLYEMLNEERRGVLDCERI